MESQTPSKSKISILGSTGSHKKVKICILFLAFVLISAGVYYGYGLFWKSKTYFTVVVDCGSTGTRLNVYKWGINDGSNRDLPILLQSYPGDKVKNPLWKNGCEYHCMQTEPGLDKFVGNYSGVRTSLVPLLRWAEGLIPSGRHGDTPIFVLATAGLRRIAVEHSRRVFEDVERVVKEHSFKWRRDWIRVLSGREEAYYGWVALNYRMGYLNRSSELPSLGLLDLGGSSLQVVMEADEVREDSHLLVSKIGLAEHQLMAYSLPAFGLNKAFDRTVAMLIHIKPMENDDGSDVRHPCLSSNFLGNYTCSSCSKPDLSLRLVGDPNWEKCKILAQAVAMNSSVSNWSMPRFNYYCQRSSPHKGKNILDIAINTKTGVRYHALSGFFAVYNMLNLNAKANLTEIWKAAQHQCSSAWNDESKVWISQYCFKVLYLASLIEDGLCLGNADIVFGPGDISWTLGASLVEGELLIWRTAGGSRFLTTTPQYMDGISSPIFLFIILVVLAFIVYRCQVKLPMLQKRSSVVGANFPSYTHSKHRPF